MSVMTPIFYSLDQTNLEKSGESKNDFFRNDFFKLKMLL